MLSEWDQRFLGLAEHVAGWSKDPSTKVGAVIANPLNRICSVAYNGFPRGVQDLVSRLENRNIKYQLIVHAEVNAIAFANEVVGCTLYVWPLPPCMRCMGEIIQNQIVRVVAPENTNPRWEEEIQFSLRIAREAGIEVDIV